MKFFIKHSVFILLLSLGHFSSAGTMGIERIKNFGNGCPNDSIQVVLSPDGEAFSILYNQFQAEVGGTGPVSAHRDCEIQVELSKPVDMTPQLVSVDYRGFVSLDLGVGAQEWSEFELDFGRASHSFARTQFHGPLSQDYFLQGRRPENSNQSNRIPRCNTTARTMFRINSHFHLQGGDATRVGTLSVDSVDGILKHTYHLEWIHCELPKGFRR